MSTSGVILVLLCLGLMASHVLMSPGGIVSGYLFWGSMALGVIMWEIGKAGKKTA